MAKGVDPASGGRPASTPVAHVPAVSLTSSPCPWPELSLQPRPAPQLPAEAHDTELRPTKGFDPAFAGRPASTPVAHVPAVSVSSNPRTLDELSLYEPTALQLPAEGHDTESRKGLGYDPPFAGMAASTPVAHVPAVSVSS